MMKTVNVIKSRDQKEEWEVEAPQAMLGSGEFAYCVAVRKRGAGDDAS